jgi:hypothetical protein
MAIAFARDIDISAALTGTNFFSLGGGRGGGVLSSTNSGLMSGGGGGSGNGMSSGGGVDSGGANVASMTCGGWGGRSTAAASCLCDNATAVAWIANAAPKAVQKYHRGGGRYINGLTCSFAINQLLGARDSLERFALNFERDFIVAGRANYFERMGNVNMGRVPIASKKHLRVGG